MTRPIRRAAMAALACLFVAPALVRAQSSLRLSPGLGVYAPLSDFGNVEGPSGLIDFGKMEGTLAYALSVDLGRPDRAVGFRFSVAYAGRADVPIDDVGCTTCQLRSTVLAASADLIARPLPSMPLLRPYAIIGAGAKMYDFDAGTVTTELVRNQAKLAGHFGIGATLFPDGGLGVFAELSDFVNGFEFADGDGNLQHDMVFVVGLTLALGG